MSISTLPEKEHAGLKDAFPKEFDYLFEGGELNDFGKVFQEVLKLRKLKEIVSSGFALIDNKHDVAFLVTLPVNIPLIFPVKLRIELLKKLYLKNWKNLTLLSHTLMYTLWKG